MRRFDFRLEQVLRWRTAVAELRKAEALACAKAVGDAEREVERLQFEQSEAAMQLTMQSGGAAMAAYAAFLEQSQRRIARARARADQARRELKAAREKLVEADRNARLLQRLREARLSEWTADTDREIEAFAAESFLNRR